MFIKIRKAFFLKNKFNQKVLLENSMSIDYFFIILLGACLCYYKTLPIKRLIVGKVFF